MVDGSGAASAEEVAILASFRPSPSLRRLRPAKGIVTGFPFPPLHTLVWTIGSQMAAMGCLAAPLYVSLPETRSARRSPTVISGGVPFLGVAFGVTSCLVIESPAATPFRSRSLCRLTRLPLPRCDVESVERSRMETRVVVSIARSR